MQQPGPAPQHSCPQSVTCETGLPVWPGLHVHGKGLNPFAAGCTADTHTCVQADGCRRDRVRVSDQLPDTLQPERAGMEAQPHNRWFLGTVCFITSIDCAPDVEQWRACTGCGDALAVEMHWLWRCTPSGVVVTRVHGGAILRISITACGLQHNTLSYPAQLNPNLTDQ
jgi:hypothetical protein